jgi:hypothetical protein
MAKRGGRQQSKTQQRRALLDAAAPDVPGVDSLFLPANSQKAGLRGIKAQGVIFVIQIVMAMN